MLPLPFRRPPSVVSCLDLAIVPGQRVSWMGRIHNWVSIHYVLKGADHILAISETTKNEIVRKAKISPDRITVTPLSHDRDLYQPVQSPERLSALRSKMGLRRPYLLSTVSTIWFRKNILNIVKAFGDFKKKDAGRHQLVFTGRKGDPVFYEEVLALIRDLGLVDDVVITGGIPAEDMATLYSGAELLLFPSLYEGFGMPILEAMACGCPVITANVSAMPEVAGNAGILVDPHSVSEIASAVQKITQNPGLRKELVEKGFVQAAGFDWAKTARQTLKVLEKFA
ncbi:MAG: glycosyltransferase family 4 protein [Spirochaetia bacterium]|nr:glycosyltransferase family 4 protein [Spirochaetia bacterium]